MLFEETKQNNGKDSYLEILRSRSSRDSSNRQDHDDQQGEVVSPSTHDHRQLLIEPDLSIVEQIGQSQLDASLFRGTPKEAFLRSPQLLLNPKTIEQNDAEFSGDEEEDFDTLDSPAQTNIVDGDDFFVVNSPEKK